VLTQIPYGAQHPRTNSLVGNDCVLQDCQRLYVAKNSVCIIVSGHTYYTTLHTHTHTYTLHYTHTHTNLSPGA